MLKPGDTAPPFTLSDHAGVARSLEDLLATGPLVLYFYPADFTPVCTEEACMFRDAASELASIGARVVGVSSDPVERHAGFAAQHRLGFTLLSDPTRATSRAYGAFGLFGILPFGTRRVTYLIDRGGRVADGVAQELGVRHHAAFVTRVVQRLRADRAQT